MGVIRKIGDIRSLVLLVSSVACAAMYLHTANEFGRSAANEKTTITSDINVKYNAWYGLRFNYYSCHYSFRVDSETYSGHGDCPQLSADDVKEGIRENIAVYYDPSNPSLNSLIEFSAASENYYRYAVPWVGVGVLIILSFVFFAVLEADKNKANGRVSIDASGTAIYPEEISSGSEFGGALSGSRDAEKSYGAANGGTASTADVTPAPGLRELYLEVVNLIHPDRAANEPDLALRERLMKEANAAFKLGDAETLQRVLDEYRSLISGL
jgi:hypothetical protein